MRLRAAPERVYALLRDYESYARWRPDVKSARAIEPIEGRPTYVEETKHGPQTYTIESDDPPHELVMRVADDSLPYGGTWTYRVVAAGDGTTLSITEDGFVKNVIFRSLARFAFGYYTNMERYLQALVDELGEDAAVERVASEA